MPSYKLSYFSGRGLGEVSRQLFHISGTPFEDDRVSMEEWPKHKESTPFGQMPVLYVDDQPLPQSFAIARYLAKQFGFAGQSPFEVAWVDALADQYKDYYQEIKPFLMVAFGFAQGDKEKLAKEVAEPAIKKFFSILEKSAWDAGLHGHFHGYFVGDSLTWIDLLISDHIDVLEGHLSNPIADYPLVQEVRDKTISHPKLKQWLAKRPVSTM
ncbi:hypothetical protein PRIPAC_90674 [Pristionchus pacificus]|uniref:glutathione transferase n=1 Tax=Pristionchus pacificus TaxID=54126 RepID=A0A2A6B8J8_PRIPA|nr:hypothetical protein PRIPAC_90674 [Pristionchus pacificus]|eukprot:PDM62206.1 Glutathione S-transferase [Pristionchus pacificus]